MVVKEKIGIVVSDKMINTRIVAVNDRITHKRYKKSYYAYETLCGSRFRV